jgi:hypothetical protein
MRNLIIGAVAAAALLGAPAAAEAATADPPWAPVTNPLGPITLPAGHNCTFAVDIFVVTNNELQDVTKLADGTTVTQKKGILVLSFRNDTTGKTLNENVSGPTTETDSPHGSSGTFQGAGPTWLAFGPHGQANTREPGLVFIEGQVTVTFTNGIAKTFSLNGTQANGCALLS